MKSPGFLSRLQASPEPLLGTWVKLPTLETLELLALAGFDFVAIDTEHAPLHLERAYQLISHAQALGMSALVRLPDLVCDDYQRLLDSGADGLLVPRVRNPEEARLAVSRMMFPPHGERGLGITSRAGDWGLMPLADYVARGNNEVLRCMQLEDRAALQSIQALLDVPGVNAVFLGMGDLQLSSGLPAAHPELQSLVDQMLDACRARGIPCGAAAQDPVAAQKAIARGFRFVMISNDAQIFGKAAVGLIQQMKAASSK